MNCLNCGHSAETHLLGIGCTEVVAWEKPDGQIIPASELTESQQTEDMGSPVFCACAKGVEREQRHESEAVEETIQGDSQRNVPE